MSEVHRLMVVGFGANMRGDHMLTLVDRLGAAVPELVCHIRTRTHIHTHIHTQEKTMSEVRLMVAALVRTCAATTCSCRA